MDYIVHEVVKSRTKSEKLSFSKREILNLRIGGEGNSKPLQYSCLENLMNLMKRQNDRTLKDEFPR